MAGIRRCRRCGELFVPSLFGLNLLIVRIRRCSVCGKFTPLFIWGDGPVAGSPVPEVRSQEKATISEEDQLRRRIEESKYDRP